MSIIFYHMQGCGFCTAAKRMFSDEISNGEIEEVDARNAPSSFRGFPTFTFNGKHHSGLPSSKKELYDKLGYESVKENYSESNSPSDDNTHKVFFGVL